jgi:peptide/nickel transport system permease protein
MQRLIPGNPADFVLGVDASEQHKNDWLHDYGLDKSLLFQYGAFLKNLLFFDFGKTYASQIQVSSILIPRLLNTISLALFAFLFSMTLGLLLGTLSAAYEGKGVDNLVAILSILTISLPSFIIGPVLLWIFSVNLNFLPLMGNQNGISSFILPGLTLGLPLAAYTIRMVRSGVVDVLNEDYIRTAYSKGLKKFQVYFKHALRNACIPTLTILGLQLGVLLSGTIITEAIFNWPGLGSLIVEAIQQREYNLVSGCVIIVSFIYVFSNFLVDIFYRILDPRVRVDS